VVVHLGQGIEPVFGQQDLITTLLQENLCAAADGVAVVDDQHLHACRGVIAHQVVSSTARRLSSIIPMRPESSDLDHLEIFFASATFRTRPVHGH
jgi:hypothetical protein